MLKRPASSYKTVHVVAAAAVIAAVSLVTSSCAECSIDAECPFGDACIDGACAERDGPQVRIVSPAPGETVPPVFDVVVEVTFQGDAASVGLRRADDADASACAPFVPQDVVVQGLRDRVTTQQATFAGVRAIGRDFTLQVLLDDGVQARGVDLSLTSSVGADLDESLHIEAPRASEQDASAGFVDVIVSTTRGGALQAWVEPEGQAPLPARVLTSSGGSLVAAMPIVRGPQILWVASDGGVCGTGFVGAPASDDDGAVEVALLYETADAPDAAGVPARGLLRLSTQVEDRSGAHVCDADVEGSDSCLPHRRGSLNRHDAESVRVRVADGVIHAAAVAGVAGPSMTAWVRVTDAGRHAGTFGPFPVQTSSGEAWIAGDIVIVGGRVAALLPTDEVQTGLPW